MLDDHTSELASARAQNIVVGIMYFLCGVLGGVFVLSFSALAAGTAAGTLITNVATATYGNAAAGQEPVASNLASFVVDRRLDVVVSEAQDGDYADAAPGDRNVSLAFRIGNNGNGVQDVMLAPVNNQEDPFGGSENFDPSNPQISV